ncbi:MAG: xylulokinase [Armatimonadetes bacterium]|nr:xylulokinase [Armatimonadota bacterium]
MARLLGIDIGTTGCKAVVVDDKGRTVWQHSVSYPLSTPHPGWTEQNPEDWWNAVQECLDRVKNKVDAVGLTGQMHGSVFLDERGQVVRPALLWNDQRTAGEVREMADTLGLQNIYEATCNPPLTGFQAPKILWLKKNEPEAFAKVRSVLLPKDYIRFRLSGERYAEVSDASGTGLFHVPERRWAHELIEGLGLDPCLFPAAAESWEPTAMCKGGKLDGVPIVGGGGDQAAGAVGTGAVEPEIISVSLGTSGVVFAAQETAEYDPQGTVHTFCHANGAWHSMGVMLSCGGALRWARDSLGFASYDEMASLARGARRSGATFKPYLAGERTPHNDPSLRGSLSGLSLADGRAEIARAVFEGVTFGLLDGYEVLQRLRGKQESEPVLRVTGGGAKSDYWMQLLADSFSAPAVRLEADEGPAFGAAILAGVGASLWPDVRSACRDVVRTGQRFQPDDERRARLRDARHAWLGRTQ